MANPEVKPAKGEQAQIDSLYRQLDRLVRSSDSLYRRLVINGRSDKYGRAVNLTHDQIFRARQVLKDVITEEQMTDATGIR